MDLTPREKLILARRRAGLSIPQAAEVFRIGRNKYWEMEAGRRDDQIPIWAIKIVSMEPHEEIWIRRKRLGWTQGMLASHIDKSRAWVAWAESGKAPSAKAAALLLKWMRRDEP